MDYFNKYIKYKKKYLQLKMGGALTQNDSISNNELYTIFACEPLLEINSSHINILQINNNSKNTLSNATITKNPSNRQTNKPAWLNDYILQLTPAIIKYATSFNSNKTQIIKDLQKDQDLVYKAMKYENDKDYIDYDTKNNGKLVECWIADNMQCPCCRQKTLRRYKRDNFPVIDIVCINPSHTRGVLFFQIKATDGSLFRNRPYFFNNNSNCEIHVGSKKFGEKVHSIKYSDDDNTKKILIGYICIKYTKKNKDILKIDSDSFIVLPHFIIPLNMSSEFDAEAQNNNLRNFNLRKSKLEANNLEKDNNYYSYIKTDNNNNNNHNDNIIRCSKVYNQFMDPRELLTNINIPEDYILKNKWNKIDNPLSSLIKVD